MKKNSFIALLICAIIFTVIGYFLGGKTPQNIEKIDTITITDTMWKDTTITETEFVPQYIIKKKVDTLYLENGDTLNLVTESKRYDKRLIIEKDTADVEIYTTGIETSLDSLKMRLRTYSVTNTIEIIKYVEKKKRFKDRFHIQPQAGVGYGFFNKKIDAYVGIGIGVDI